MIGTRLVGAVVVWVTPALSAVFCVSMLLVAVYVGSIGIRCSGSVDECL
jgi:hypothetical protein